MFSPFFLRAALLVMTNSSRSCFDSVWEALGDKIQTGVGSLLTPTIRTIYPFKSLRHDVALLCLLAYDCHSL